MRLLALGLHAHAAATSRLTLAPTARFTVVARAMSELVGGGDEPTTTAEERAEAATLRTTEGAADVARKPAAKGGLRLALVEKKTYRCNSQRSGQT